MEKNDKRPLDFIGSRKRIFDSIRFDSPSDYNAGKFPQFTPGLTGSGGKFEEKNGGRNGFEGRLTGILQSSLSSAEEKRNMETGNRFISSKYVHFYDEVQNGNDSFHTKFDRNRQLCNFSGFNRRILPYNDFTCVKEIPAFCSKRRSTAIPGSPIWNKISSTSIHQTHGSNRGLYSNAGTQSPSVFRRLATSPSSAFQSSGRSVSHMANCNETRSYSKHSKVGIDTNKRIHICGYDVPYGAWSGTSPPSQNRVSIRNYSDGFDQNDNISSFNAITTGLSECCGRPRHTRQTAHETPSIPISQSVASSSRSIRSRNNFVQPIQVPSEMVAESVSVHDRGTPAYIGSRAIPLHGCVSNGVGSASGTCGSCCSRYLVKQREAASHQQSRVDSCLSSARTVCYYCHRENCSTGHRQHNSCVLHSQTRGDTFPSTFSGNLETTPLVSVPIYTTARKTCSRATQCSSGQFIPPKQSVTSGMDFETGNCSITVQNSRDSNGRSVCNQTKSSSTSLCIAGTRTSSLGSRRSVSGLEANVRVCISPIHSDTCNTQEDSTLSAVQNPSDSTCLASEVVVQRPTELPCGLTDSPSPSEGSTFAVSGSSSSHEPRNVASSRMALIERSVREKQFSEKVASRIAKSRRPSTRIVYDAKWNIFSNWCKSRSFNPEHPSMNNLASFFLYLFEDKELAVSTIKGYRSMLSNTLKFKGGESIGSNPFLSELMRSFELERPVSRSLTPKWDLSCVLWSLTKTPYEPLSGASIKFLTMKTVFLLAFATARRRSELHAFSVEEGCLRFNKSDGSVSLLCQPGFLAKNQLPHILPEPINVPSLANSCGRDDTDRVLCPVRSLKFYLKRVEASRGSRKRLFLPLIGNKDISAASVSRWISDVIKFAYQDLSDTDLSFLRIRPHELRALSSSWAFLNKAPLEDVLRAAFWRSPNTFSSFYLRSFSAQASNLHSLGPLVAAQRVIRK